MPAYLIANVDVKDVEKIKKYLESTPPVIKKYSGRFLVRGGEIWNVEGDLNIKRLVIIEFDSFEKAKEFWNSEEYEPLKKIRQSAAKTDAVIVEGIAKGLAQALNQR